MKKLLVVCDNLELLMQVRALISTLRWGESAHVITVSSKYANFRGYASYDFNTPRGIDRALDADLLLSVHCKQILPRCVVEGQQCFNVHPGLFPHGRGMYPYVFAIANGFPAGATLHKMDEKIDHGAVIAWTPVPVKSTDNCQHVYDRIRKAELDLIAEWGPKLLKDPELSGQTPTRIQYHDTYKVYKMSDYKDLCRIDLDKVYTAKDFLKLLQALTFGDQANAWYEDEEGNKVKVRIHLEKEPPCPS